MASLQITVQHRRVQRQDRWPVSAVFDAKERLPYRQEGEFVLAAEWEIELCKLSWLADDS